MPENTKTVYNLSSACQIATEWLQECKQNHPDCAFPYKSNLSPLPARVLDLDSNPPSPTPESIFLRIGKESKGEYAILSHCWGGTTVITTTTANVRTFIDHGIDYETMPRTFRDAIDVCRQLGIRYLWIDSLCIIQDDEKDWEVESAKMADYYAGAMITLAANAGPTGDYGFFKWQSVLESTHISAEPPQSTDASVPQDSERGCIASLSLGRAHPLEYRAWVLQEQTLSRRVLSFNRGEVDWACTEARSNMGPDRSLQGLLTQGPVLDAEPGPHIGVGIRGSGTMVQRYGPNPLNLIVNPGLDPGSLLFSPSGLWYLLITNYSCRRLTFVSDKLPALAGLAKLYQNSREDKFLAGLWQSDIVMGLMWRHLGSDSEKSCGRPKELKSIPTWSWASVGGGVAWLKMYVANRRTDLVMQTPEVTYSGTPLTSPISTATLTFLSRMEKVIIGTEIIGGDGINSRHHLPVWRNDGAGSHDEKPGEAIGTCLLDYNLGNDSREIYAMYLMTHDNLEEGDHSWGPFRTAHDALLLEPTGNDREYRRIGVGWFEGKSEVFHPGKCIYQTIHVV
jgi:hypothetical protein